MPQTALCYFTGTGNTLAIARQLAAGLDRAELLPIAQLEGPGALAGADCIGLLAPVYVWGLPRRVVRFLRALDAPPGAYLFAVVTCGGGPGRALCQVERLLGRRGRALAAGWSVQMPSNYIVAGGAEPADRQERLFARAAGQVAEIQAAVRARQQVPFARPSPAARLLLALVYHMSLPMFPQLDRLYRADERCNGCGVCIRACPAGNIRLVEGRPHWQHRCEQCFACLQWCPQEAIQFGRQTADRARYHHPQVQVKDLFS